MRAKLRAFRRTCMRFLRTWALPCVLTGLLVSQADTAFSYRALAEPGADIATKRSAAAAVAATPTAEVAAEPQRADVTEDCQQRIAAVRAAPGLPGAPQLQARKDIVLLYAKGEPVHFAREPAAEPHVSQAAISYRAMLKRAHAPWGLLQRLAGVFAANVELGRAVLLREGYLFADEPKLAFALVDLVSAQLLFNEKQIWIQRGDRLLHAERTGAGQYAFSDGAERGRRVRLMLFDRIGVGTPPPALHRDFRELRQRLGFDRARILHETPEALVAELRYGSRWIETLLSVQDAHLELACELAGADGEQVRAHRAEQIERWRVLHPLRGAMLAQVEEGLPFDEPRLEYGQQDGQMRGPWQRAYAAGRLSFEFNDGLYYVFDAQGRPRVPQVCIDFIFDTFQRAGGSWWRTRGQPPGRTPGRLEWSSLTSLDLRRANSIVDLARAQPELLELHALAERERVPFKHGPQLAAYLTEHADEYMPGDIVLIRGYAPWDKPWMPKVMHQHSFFVYETDPLSGMPIVLAGNPGEPLLQTWQFEAFRTPERSIQYRIRPRLEWLRKFLDAPAEVPPPALLTIDPRAPKVPRDIPTPPGVALQE